MLDLLKRLSQTPGISGREERVRALVKEELENLADEVKVDAIGNVIAFKKGKSGSKKIMICGHMDEIGFIVSHLSGPAGPGSRPGRFEGRPHAGSETGTSDDPRRSQSSA